MGNCCPTKETRKKLWQKLPPRPFKNRKRKKRAKADDGSEVMNAIAGELWPTMAGAMMDKMKAKSFPMRPYEMVIVGGGIGHCPFISNVVLIQGEEGLPVTFVCDVQYEGKPELEFKMKAATAPKGSFNFSSFFMPDVNVELHWVDFNAKMHIEVSMIDKYVKLYFLEPPEVRWDLDVEVSSLEIPINVEDILDTRLEKEFETITQEKPKVIKFGASSPQQAPTTARSDQKRRKPKTPKEGDKKKRKKKKPHVFKTAKQKEEEAAALQARSFDEEEAELKKQGKTEKEIEKKRKKFEKQKSKDIKKAEKEWKKSEKLKARMTERTIRLEKTKVKNAAALKVKAAQKVEKEAKKKQKAELKAAKKAEKAAAKEEKKRKKEAAIMADPVKKQKAELKAAKKAEKAAAKEEKKRKKEAAKMAAAAEAGSTTKKSSSGSYFGSFFSSSKKKSADKLEVVVEEVDTPLDGQTPERPEKGDGQDSDFEMRPLQPKDRQ